MTKYTVHNYHVDWVNAKHAAHLSDKLFTKGLGGKLDALNTLHTQAMAALDSKKFIAIAKKLRAISADVKKIVPVYSALVAKNGNNKAATRVLNAIYQSGHRTMLDEIEEDLRDKGENVF